MLATPGSASKFQHKERVLNDGLYIKQLCIVPGVSRQKILNVVGTEDERSGVPGQVGYLWNLKGYRFGAEFDAIGSVHSAYLALDPPLKPLKGSYAKLRGHKVVLGSTTLKAVRKAFPDGKFGDTLEGDGWTIITYVVRFGPEATMEMKFSVSWQSTSFSGAEIKKSPAQRDAMAVSFIEVGYEG
jgi:hypothetical protein